MVKDRVLLDVPISVGFFVLEYAKLLLLSFYFDFLVEFISFDKFALIQCDTDSMYFSLSEPSLFLAVALEKRSKFIQQYENWFARDYCHLHKEMFFECMFNGSEWKPESCCKVFAKYDSRTVGKFHTEWKGDGIIALCSKCYYCIGDYCKHSSKGISKRHNQLTAKDYKDVLTSQTISKGTNRGFRVRGPKIFTYTQNRKGLNYLYSKRKVGEDGITTYPTHL